jgi:hypothetical protein
VEEASMSCGLEAMVLVLQLAKELMDVPMHDHIRSYAMEYDVRYRKLKEFHAIVDMCLTMEKIKITTTDTLEPGAYIIR